MTTLNVELPDEILEDITEIAKELDQSPEEFMQMALSLLMQSDSLSNAMVAMERVKDKNESVALPSLDGSDDSELIIELHPEALAELHLLAEEDQVDVLSDLIERVLSETEEEEMFTEGLDLVINETEDSQLILSSFDYGDIVYKLSDKIVIYLLNLPDLMPDDEDGDEEEEEGAH